METTIMNREFAPVVLFVYNRPEHTARTVEALKKNVGAEYTELYVYCDYAKNEAAMEKMQQTRDYVRSITGFDAVHIIERTENYGLAKSVITGVTEVIRRHGKVIVMEDDLITSKYFLEYMNVALEKYEFVKNVFSITGYSHFPNGHETLPESYFIKVFSSWSWATWSDRWATFDEQAVGWEETKTNPEVARAFDYENSFDNCLMLKNQMEDHIINSWAIRAYWTMFKQDGVTLFTNKRLCENIGNDGSGVHCGADNGYVMTELEEVRITQFPNVTAERPEVRSELISLKQQQKQAYKKERIKFYLLHPVKAVKKVLEKLKQ